MDYTYLYKHSYQRIDEIQNLLPYDIFISSYVNSQRVQEPADNIQAGQKIWFATEEEEPSIRNSNLFPVNANGEVRFLSVLSFTK